VVVGLYIGVSERLGDIQSWKVRQFDSFPHTTWFAVWLVLSESKEESAMNMRIDEQTIVDAAREWAKRSGKNEAVAVGTAQETMITLQASLPHKEYETALEKLYQEYSAA
jgi:uncharacterized protein (DUF2342 family)